jgi:hypothetical protein
MFAKRKMRFILLISHLFYYGSGLLVTEVRKSRSPEGGKPMGTRSLRHRAIPKPPSSSEIL